MFSLFKKACDPISSYTHFIGVIMGILLLIYFIIHSVLFPTTLPKLIGYIIFAFSIIALYSASSIYHYISNDSKYKTLFRKIDHSMIYCLIAGTYSVVVFTYFPLKKALLFIIFIWFFALIGIITKIFLLNMPRIFYTLIYVVMGWAIVFDYKSFMVLEPNCLLLIALGGIAYTIGAIIYIIKKPNINKQWGFHELFHIFILIGTLCHILACLIFMI